MQGSGLAAGLRHGMGSCSPPAAQTTRALAKLACLYGGCGYYRQPGAGCFFAPAEGGIRQKSNRRAPKLY